MQTVGIGILPPFGGDDMTDGIGIAVLNDFGIAGGAAAEEHQHRIGGFVFRITGIGIGETAVFSVEVIPAFALTVDDDFDLKRRRIFHSGINIVGNAVIGGRDDRLDSGRVETVNVIFGQQLVAGRDGDGADPVQSVDDEPVLVVTFEHQHNAVTFGNTKACQIIGGAAGVPGDIGKGEIGTVMLFIDPCHSQFFRIFGSDGIDDIVSKVEVIRTLEFGIDQMTFGIDSFIDKLLADPFSVVGR